MGNLLCNENAPTRSRAQSSNRSLDSSGYTTSRRHSSVSASCPQQQFFVFEEICFDSRFESGNLARVRASGQDTYNLWIAPDCSGTMHETKYKVWFYFSVSNVDLAGATSRTFTFRIKNMNKHQHQNYLDGMVPAYCGPSTGDKWQYLPTPLKGIECINNKLEIAFEYTFTSQDAQYPTYFAFTFPYTYTRYLEFASQLEGAYAEDPDIYFQRELLTYSLEGRRIDLLTITSQDPSIATQNSPEIEPNLEDLFENCETPGGPDTDCSDNNKSFRRPFVFRKKKYIFISCRVHPCETPSSFVLEGLLKSLLNKNDATSRILLQRFVFVIIPMLNPDGVYKGHYRCDTNGKDLDKVYQIASADKKAYPSIYALLKVVKSLSDGRLVTYLDLHAHSARSSGFIVGNYQDDVMAKTDMRLFATVYDVYSKYFDVNSCMFGIPPTQNTPNPQNTQSRQSDNKKIEDGKSVVGKNTGLIHCYKLESGYYQPSKKPEKYSITSKDSEIFPNGKENEDVLDIKKFEEIGESIRHVLLEVLTEHPKSKLGKTPYGSTHNMRNMIYEDLAGKQLGGTKLPGEGEETEGVLE